jgi:hypothetical protein
MINNTKHHVRNSYTPTDAKEGEERSKSRESRRRKRVKHSMHIFSKYVL